jgi:hypothetical protein
MKTFAGNKTLIIIKQQCAAAGVAVDDYNFRKHGHDFIGLGIAASKTRPDGSPVVPDLAKPSGYVLFNTFNGRFFGKTDKGVPFSSDSAEHEAEPWFQALLSFFYVEQAANDSTKPRRKAA